MKKHICLLTLTLSGYSMIGFADDSISYGYDKANHIIYAQKNGRKETLKFIEDYIGNPSYSFDFFSGIPAIIVDSRSLHDSTVYATLVYNNKFVIDCLYLNIKSKKNGVLVKEGVCELEKSPAEEYSYFIDENIRITEEDMDSIDTSLILNGKKNYLPIVLYNSPSQLIYKLYINKENFLNDDYSILSINDKGKCEIFSNSPWLIFSDKNSGRVEIMDEKNPGGKLELNKAVPEEFDDNKCSTYPAISVTRPKSYFYDSLHKVKKSYLVKGDKVNLLSVSADGKWCKARYINKKNKSTESIMLCSDLSI